MRKILLIVAILAAALPQLIASPENDAIVAAAKSFMSANATLTTGITVTVEKIDGNFARARVNPKDAGAADPAWIFLKKEHGKWTGLTVGTSFEAADYEKMGIPKSLRIE